MTLKLACKVVRPAAVALIAGAIFVTPVLAQDDAAALAKKLSNPIAALISVPLQLNYDQSIGPAEDGDKWSLYVQPVVPIELNKEWNVISRTVLPIVSQDEIYPGAGSQSGLGDTVQSVFFSPKATTASGWIWGAGPVFLLPTGSDDLLTADKWGAGPTVVVLKQEHGWTYGALGNHLWSFAGNDSRADVSLTFLQPFLSYTTPKAWTFTINSESTYDWQDQQWSAPVHALVTKVTKVGSQLVSVGGGLRYWAASPDSGAGGLGVRVVITLLFPK
jgi:hypothetical protein